ncbi:hypothetical protein ACFPPD_07905 [Cohnella suwonensis]|uniref:Glycosyltransferase n=1 Tax=Cohnella suwonensis TaxID=696072 RepID=A0ABW0LRW9_9BACL
MSSNESPLRHLRHPSALPSIAHLRRLTDDTGILEHALGRIPRRREGYTTDDNARALWTATEWLELDGGAAESADPDELRRLADTYLAFMLWAQDENGWFSNNFAYDRSLEEEEVSHDCQGRSFWACADAWVRLDGHRQDAAKAIVERAMPTLRAIESLRGQAFAMAACAHLLEASERGRISLPFDVAIELRHHSERLENVLNRAYLDFRDDRWRWFEPAMTYSNGVLPWAMLRTYRYTRTEETMLTGMESLNFLLGVMVTDGGWLRPVGNEGWCTSDGDAVSRWDQQPLELFKLALALEEASLVLDETGEDRTAKVSETDLNAMGNLVGILRGSGSGFGIGEAGLTGNVKGDEGGSGPGRANGLRGSSGLGSISGLSGSSGLGRASGVRDASGLGRASGVRDASGFRSLRDRCRSWYYGDNDLGAPVADPTDGSCCDGLTPSGPNINCGAEATISYLMTEAICKKSRT